MLALSSQVRGGSPGVTSGPVLAVSGLIGPGNRILVDPVYSLQSTEATDDGPYEIAGFDRDSRELFRAHFDAIDPGGASTVARAFAAEVPVTQSEVARLASLRVSAGSARRTLTGTGASDPQPHVYRDRAGQYVLTWDARAFPEIAISSTQPGAELDLATATGGHYVFATKARAIAVDFSNGLRSYRRVVALPA